ncbi:MAG: ATP-dependent protease La (LON) domain protein [Gammaproteobacteria bacterium]|nr:ATP-dependent protease La (LON) domain protein [Gammaproteobacteria bacterium]MAV61163.1 ATP-dependent protease La (LON) domain protein [Gammaproteobacteria bacterium]
MKKNNLPIFPLGIVALPGTVQNLQIFEPRYIDMVKKCMKNNHGFVITFQKKLSDKDDYEISEQGTYVEIVDFNNLPNGLLVINVKSLNKVSIKNIVKLEDGLNIAQTNPIVDPEVDDQALLAEFPEISNILSQLIRHPRVADLPINVDFNSADSVAYHLAGLIPIPWSHKQSLLEAFDASQRFSILSKYIDEISSN